MSVIPCSLARFARYCANCHKAHKCQLIPDVTKHVSEIIVTLGPHVYHLSIAGKRAIGRRSRHVRGIKLKEEELHLQQFLDDLSAALQRGRRRQSAGTGGSRQVRPRLRIPNEEVVWRGVCAGAWF